MMDPLGATATAIGLAQLSGKVWEKLYKFQTFRDVSDVGDLLNAMQDLQSGLEILTVRLQSDTQFFEDRAQRRLFGAVINGYYEQCSKLLLLLSVLDDKHPGLQKPVWPFKKRETAEILVQLRIHQKNLEQLLQVVHLQQNTAAEWSQNIYRWLNASDQSSSHREARRHQISGTGQWFIESNVYVKWKSTLHSFLSLSGIPGSGKTVLFSTIVEDIVKHCALDSSTARPVGVAYFYFSWMDSSKQHLEQLIRSLVAQLVAQSKEESRPLKALYSECQSGQSQPTVEQLQRVLDEMLRDFQEVYILIDALDECENSRFYSEHVVDLLNRWKQENVHLLVTSRGDFGLREVLQDVTTEHVDLGREIAFVERDIQTYVLERLQKERRLSRWPPSDREEIVNALVAGSNGMFRWVVCQTDALQRAITRKQLRQALSSLPKTLHGTYVQTLLGISLENQEQALMVFQWLYHSLRPLRLEEAAEAIAIDPEDEPAFLAVNRLIDIHDVLKIASSLVTIVRGEDGTDQLKFAHFSVKEFLNSRAILSGPASHFHVKDDGGGLILKMSLLYLRNFQEAGTISWDTFSAYPLAEYAAEFWIRHAVILDPNSQKDSLDDIKPLIMSLIGNRTAFKNWIRLFDPNDPSKKFPYVGDLDDVPQPLYYMSLAGLSRPVQWLLEEESVDVNKIGGRYGTALQAAAAGGHMAVVKTLLRASADVNTRGGDYGSSLQAAVAGGHTDVLNVLVESGADVNAQSLGIYGSALQAAAVRGNKDVVGLLLAHGADVNVQGGHYGNALQAAAAKGYQQVCELLIGAGADINAQGGFYGSPLLAAVIEGYTDTAKLLLAKGGDVSMQRRTNLTPLHEASIRGHVGIVRLFMFADVLKISATDETERTALHMAASRGHDAVLKLLLHYGGVDVDAKDKDGMTALHCAADGGYVTAVEVLLAAGADINAIDHQRCTPLHLAIQKRHGRVHRLLIDQGAKTDVVNKKKLTPSQLAFQKMNIRPSRYCSDKRRTQKLTGGRQALSVEVLRRKPDTESHKERHRFLLKKTFSLTQSEGSGRGLKNSFLREYDVLQRLYHPNIVQFLGYKEHKSKRQAYLFLEYCTEGDLCKYIRRDPESGTGEMTSEMSEEAADADITSSSGSMSSDPSDTSDSPNEVEEIPSAEAPSLLCQDIWSILLHLALALSYCHHGLLEENARLSFKLTSQTILHRDIKPANVVITKDHRNLLVAKLCDLGLAKVFDKNLRQTRGIGSVKYMPPECRDRLDMWTPKGDIYSLGAALGDLNLRRSSDIKTEKIPALQKSEDDLDIMLDACTEDQPKDRPSSLVIIQTAREHLYMVPSETRWSLNFSKLDPSYPFKALLESLENLFYFFSEREMNHAMNFVPRFHSLWEDIGPKTGNEILWSDNECTYLKILLKRSKPENEGKKEANVEELWEPRSKPVEGETRHSDCRWNTRSLSAPDINELLTKELKAQNLQSTMRLPPLPQVQAETPKKERAGYEQEGEDHRSKEQDGKEEVDKENLDQSLKQVKFVAFPEETD